MKKKNQKNSKNKYWFAGLTLTCILLMGLSMFYEKIQGPLKAAAAVTVIPMQQGISYMGTLLGDVSENFTTLQDVKKENAQLKEKIETLQIENNNLQQEKYELERLKELMKLDQNYADYEKTAAHVIGTESDNWFHVFTIDKGSNDGIKKDMNVIAGSGLVGIVTKVGPNWATVRSIIDDSSNLSGMALTTSDRCIVSGDLKLINEGKIKFDRMENNEHVIQVGDQIVTSHISNKYLQGILIGYISEINVDSNNLTRSGYITPAVDFKNLQEVLVIMKTKQDLTNEK